MSRIGPIRERGTTRGLYATSLPLPDKFFLPPKPRKWHSPGNVHGSELILPPVYKRICKYAPPDSGIPVFACFGRVAFIRRVFFRHPKGLLVLGAGCSRAIRNSARFGERRQPAHHHVRSLFAGLKKPWAILSGPCRASDPNSQLRSYMRDLTIPRHTLLASRS
jgi:hypothetical protein